VTFAAPLVLIALVAIPLLIRWYTGEQRRRRHAAEAFVTPALAASVAPRRPGWRRHAPMLAFAVAIAVLIVAAARPQRTVAVPVNRAAIMLANDVSASMRATDVSPSRLVAARRAAARFVSDVPASVQVGLLKFANTPIVLQSPTGDHAATQAAIAQLQSPTGHTAIGDALLAALHALRSLPAQGGKRPPGAIVLLSDGGSDAGSDPIAAAREARAEHIPVYTIALGTPNGTIPVRRGTRTVATPVPVSPQELDAIASSSGGRAFTAGSSSELHVIYAHLAAELGHKKVKREITASFAGGGLVLLLLGSALSLRWFGRLV